MINVRKAPFPWFGGKSKAAPAVWAALGDVEHYVEPFAGSLAVLLNRPHLANRTYYSETVNDLDGFVVNAWRALQLHPDATAEAASWPVAEADLTARHAALVRWRAERDLEHLMGDPSWCDPVVAGWWLWGISCWIGSGWCSGTGAWVTDDDGRIVKQSARNGVNRQLPHLGDDGKGVNRPQLREPGVGRQLPSISNDGQGVNRPQLREPGVNRKRPHLSNDGRGVNRPQLREPGVDDDGEFHPLTMPELRRWFGWLSARLRHVRIVNGDWRRVVTSGAAQPISARMGGGHAGIFLDPPYADTASRVDKLYAVDSLTVAHDVREWCKANGDNERYRIVLAGFDVEHEELERHGWSVVEWFAAGFLSGGMGNTSSTGGTHQQHRERLWLSPHCLIKQASDDQLSLFDTKETA